MFAASVLINASVIINIVEEVSKAFKAKVSQLRKLEKFETNPAELSEIQDLKAEFEDSEAISARGYFVIDRGFFVNMLSFGLTYIVILLQFKVGEIQ